MRGRLIVIAGTGTNIGKTHLGCALLRAAGDARACGLKPVESGVDDGSTEGPDGRALRESSHSTFHVKHAPAPYLLRRAVSPHLAAREERRTIELAPIEAYVQAHRSRADVLLVELPGGLFSPLGNALTNVDVALRLRPDRLVLVAPDRLGVLHDVGATLRAAAAATAHASLIAVVAPEQPDASTGTNAAELAALTHLPVYAIPRAPAETLASTSILRGLYAACVA